jgi:hypothetical protein
MVRTVPVVAVVVACALGIVRAQSPRVPDLTGGWALENGVTNGPYGPSFSAVQDASSLAIEYGTVTMRLETGQGRSSSTMSPGQPMKMRFSLDGLDTAKGPDPAAIPDQSVAPPAPGMMTVRMVSTVSRAAWMGDQLVIVTRNISHLHRPLPAVTEVDMNQTVRHIFTLEASDRLKIDRLIAADPLPGGLPQRSEASGTWTTTYLRVK